METIVGIDLGTTNSEIAAMRGGKVQVLGSANSKMLPSCVGLTPAGELLIGQPARNQQLIFPERTAASVKRQMGSDDRIPLGDKDFSPQEISALILRQLAQWASAALGETPKKAVITVPAYFSDAQRQATREAGELADLEVVRILNEPTAASLAYGRGGKDETVMVYDLGGGTFDVSIVRFEGEITEVLASHGNNKLGGDDFTKLLAEHLAKRFTEKHGVDPRKESRVAFSRIWSAAEEAKKGLSAAPYVKVREEALLETKGKPLHLDLELSRDDYEGMIRPLIDTTLESVTQAITQSKLSLSGIDSILLVGGSTRTPLVHEQLRQRSGLTLSSELHPDLCVALGAGVLASRLAGQNVERILVDITPYSFGVSYLAERGGSFYPHCYKPIIYANTALPVTRTERYYTGHPGQTEAEINIFEGDDEDALRNIFLGRFVIEDLTPSAINEEVLVEMKLDLDGILHVTAIEKKTGLSKKVTITDALTQKSPEEIAETRDRLSKLFKSSAPEEVFEYVGDDAEEGEDSGRSVFHLVTEDEDSDENEIDENELDISGWGAVAQKAESLLARSRDLLPKMHEDDREEAVEIHERILAALEDKDHGELEEATAELSELLYFVDGAGK